jgi:hypothetical protein
MKTLSLLGSLLLLIAAVGCRTGSPSAPKHAKVWRGIHLEAKSDRAADQLIAEMPKLAALGVNALIVEVDYSFEFQSHPELRPPQFLSKAKARELAAVARTTGIRLIPSINCLGHQSWSGTTFSLLTKYPEFDETPGAYPENKGIYCRSWCPQHPDVNRVIFALIDELTEAFQADAFHVGMDEVFLIASPHCPRCRGGDPAKLFAKAVNDLHGHIVGQRKLEMMMWGDRFLDGKATGYGEWEAATNGTQGAVDLVPKDIVLCDWHYEMRDSYPSLPFLLAKGFRVWPAGWKNSDNAARLIDDAKRQNNPRMVGYLATTWGSVKNGSLSEWPPLVGSLQRLAEPVKP